MPNTRLQSIVRSVLLQEVREFVSTTITADDGTEMIGSELVREIRNALWMPQGITEHARLLLAASNIDPEREGSGEDRTQSEIESGFGAWKRGFVPSLRKLSEELELLDMHMEEFIRERFGLALGVPGPVPVKLRVPQGVGVRRRDNAVAYDMFRLALQGSMRSSVDTSASRAAHKGGRYDPMRSPGWNAVEVQHDLTDAVIQDFMEVLLQPEDAAGMVFDKVTDRMNALVDHAMEHSSAETFKAVLKSALEREKGSARAKLLRAEKERGASVPDAAVHELVKKVGEVIDLFFAHIVLGKPGSEPVPREDYGDAFAAIIAKSCGIDSDYELPSSLRASPIRPLLPERVDKGIVDFVDAVHEEIERQVKSLPTLRSVHRNILNPQEEFYSSDGTPNPPFTYDSPHPDYA